MWKDFFYFSKRERRGILFLIVLIAGVFLGKFLFTPPQATSHPTGEPDMKNKIKETTSNEVDKTKEETGGNYARTSNRKPARNFSSQQDKPAEKRTYYPSAEKSPAPPKQTNYPLTEKFAEGTVIELNESDTIQLMKIPGVGPAFAKRIAGYRNLLGGFYRLEQLQEVYGMYEELYEKITPYLRVDSNRVTFIPVNMASLDKLKSHPYINFYQAKAIIEMRKKKGKLNTISELILLEEFTEEDMNRIRCYLSF